MRGRMMRRAATAAVAACVIGSVSPATANHPTRPDATLWVEIVAGNGGVDSEFVDPLWRGEWHFVAQVSGRVDEVFVQLWKPDRNGGCVGELLAEKTLSGSDEKPFHRREVAAGSHEFELDSPMDAGHCVRLILWGSRNAEVEVGVHSPAAVDDDVLPLS